VFIIDSLLIGGLRFVLDKVAAAVDTELNDDTAQREQLLAAEMRLELGEISRKQFDIIEAEILTSLREIRARAEGGEPAALSSRDYRVAGIEASFGGEEHE
jgi:hypothetical protein